MFNSKSPTMYINYICIFKLITVLLYLSIHVVWAIQLMFLQGMMDVPLPVESYQQQVFHSPLKEASLDPY